MRYELQVLNLITENIMPPAAGITLQELTEQQWPLASRA
jgi:hypothetical protein